MDRSPIAHLWRPARRLLVVGAIGVVSVGLAGDNVAAAGDVLPGPYPGQVERVIDGDTVRVRVRIWLDQDVEVAVRLATVDAPELRGSACPRERRQAEAARDLVMRLVAENDGRVRLRDVEHDKFGGRVVARLELDDGRFVGDEVLAAGLAVLMGASDEGASGDADALWCPIAGRGEG